MFGSAIALYSRALNWAIGSDPGLLRLRMAARTTVSLAVVSAAIDLGAEDVVAEAARAAHAD